MTVLVVNIPDTESKVGGKIGKSIFLAGPTPRSTDVKSWRPEFIERLDSMNFDCTVLVPETASGWWLENYDQQCQWEYDHLHKADLIAFWVPRDLDTMPGFTTNIEFGYWVTDPKTIYGRPNSAPKTRYLDWLYKKEHNVLPCESMDVLVHDLVSAMKAMQFVESL